MSCPANTWKALWCISIFPFFPLSQKYGCTPKPLFWPVEALGFTELKTTSVYTFAPLKNYMVGVAAEITVIRIAAISYRQRVGFEIACDLGI